MYMYHQTEYLSPFLTLDWQLALTLTEDLLTTKTGRLLKKKTNKLKIKPVVNMKIEVPYRATSDLQNSVKYRVQKEGMGTK